VRSYPLTPCRPLSVAVFAIGNAVLGLRLMWLLMRDPTTPEETPPAT
jgi:hypothetical protein